MRKLCGIVLFFVSLSCAPLFAREATLQEICFELVRYNKTKNSAFPLAKVFSKITKYSSDSFAVPIFDAENRVFLYKIEKIMPQKIGVLDSSFSAEDVFSYEEMLSSEPPLVGSWVNPLIMAIHSSDKELKWPRITESFEYVSDIGVVNLLDEEDSGTSFKDKEGRIRRYVFGDEQMAISEFDGFRYVVSSYKNRVTRRSFDESLRVVKSEEFSLGSSASNLSLSVQKNYYYKEGANKPYWYLEINNAAKTKTEAFYNLQGFPSIVDEYHFVSTDEKKGEGEYVHDKKSYLTYDSENRVKSDRSTSWFYGKTSGGKSYTDVINSSYIYTYTTKSDAPDFIYYEDDVLRVKRVYSAQMNYKETINFDEGFSVEAEYVNGVRSAETVFYNSIPIRRRTFEY
ncbi:hypothetical protein [Treponema zioleckii]|uniref:hypothetical protein n=1 Tax=Treponema zioleckii TaxID=331680 RepID=UPI00168A6300|nr:hypothetical protein [Treponema zioleckii]